MKRINILALLCILLLICSCNNERGGNQASSNKLRNGQIEMKGYPNTDFIMSFTATVKSITIDWGDGIVEEITPNGIERTFTHIYSNENYKTITVSTDSMTYFATGIHDLYKGKIGNSGEYHELRFGDCIELEEIKCSGEKLITLDVSNKSALTTLWCHKNQLTLLDISGCAALSRLDCYDNLLTSLNMSCCSSLEDLSCSGNQLTSLDMSKCRALVALGCGDNRLTSLNISGCYKLSELYCSNNQLISLEIESRNLCLFDCSNNLLTSIEIESRLHSVNRYLRMFHCNNNQLTTDTLNSIFEALPIQNGYIAIGGNPGTSTCNKDVAVNKRWRVSTN